MPLVKRQSAGSLIRRNIGIYSKAEELNRRIMAAPAEKKLALLTRHQRLWNESFKNREKAIALIRRNLMRTRNMPREDAGTVAALVYSRAFKGMPLEEALKKAISTHTL